MNLRKIILIPFFAIISICSFFSCGEDRWKEYEYQTALDSWMYDIMNQNYLWYQKIPDYNNLNLFLTPEAFLAKIKASGDNYSFVDSVLESPLPTYGFDYSLVRNPDNDTAYNALITYVIPGSPADLAGMQRGNWIMKVDTSFISKKYEVNLLQGFAARKLVMGEWKEVEIVPGEGEEIPEEPEYVYKVAANLDTLDMGAAKIVEDSPIHSYKILTLNDGSEAGYLMYNSFTAGTNEEPEKYNNKLRAISQEIYQRNIHRLILDLRYNEGGSIDCAQLLGTILAPASYLNDTMVVLEYNDKNANRNRALTFDSQLLKSGKNTDLNTLILLVSGQTAGAPEMMIHGLNGKIHQVIAIGSSTKGQNVATEKFINEEYSWAVNPAVCSVYNSDKETYSSFLPTYSASTTDYQYFLPFGDPNETLLSIAIEVLEGTYPPQKDAQKYNKVTTPFKIEKSVRNTSSIRFEKGLRIK